MTTPTIPSLPSVPVSVAVTEAAIETGIKPELLAKAQLVMQSITSGHQQLNHPSSGLELIVEGKSPAKPSSSSQTLVALPSAKNVALILAAIESPATTSKIDNTTLDQLIAKLTDQLTMRSLAQAITLKGTVVQASSAQVEIRIPNQSQTLLLPLKSVTPIPQSGDQVTVTLRPPVQPGGVWHAQLSFDTQAGGSPTTPSSQVPRDSAPTTTRPLQQTVESSKSGLALPPEHRGKVDIALTDRQTNFLLATQLNGDGLRINTQKLAAPLTLSSSRIPAHNSAQAVSPIINLSAQRQQLTVSITTVDPLAKLSMPPRGESSNSTPSVPVTTKLIQQQLHSNELAQALGFRKLESSATKALGVLQIIEARGLNVSPLQAPRAQVSSAVNEPKQTLPQVLLAHIQSRHNASARLAFSHSDSGVGSLAPLIQSLASSSGITSEQTAEWLAIWRKNLKPLQDVVNPTSAQNKQSELGIGNSSRPEQLQAKQIHRELAKMLESNAGANSSPMGGKGSDTVVTSEPPIVQSLRQLLSAPASPISAASLVSPVQNHGFVGALISLLQLTLAGRAIRQQPSLTKLVEQASKEVTRTAGSMPTAQQATPRTLLDIAQLDNRHNLLNQLRTLLAGHQQQKMRHAEQMLQGQETFYYVLPTSDSKQAPHELLIRREPQREDKKQQKADAKRQWQLTMKLSIGDMGELLAKSRITGDELDLDIYTSTDELLNKVRDTLPFLLRRFESLGLSVNHKQVQRGKIPAHLDERPYHILETQA